MNEYQFFSPVDVVFGCGSLSKLHTLKMPGKKALLVISNGKSARMNGSLDRTIDELKQADVSYVLYNGIGANPLKSAVEEGARIGRENGVDFVVALGGVQLWMRLRIWQCSFHSHQIICGIMLIVHQVER
ncbi:MAG: iron-containing alcohol dehydrogenase [Lachnospira eligens]